MAETTIAWCRYTFNPWRGCDKISAGCKNCYAAAGAKRFPLTLGVWGKDGTRVLPVESTWEDPRAWDRKARREGKRERVFSGSYCDVFEDRSDLIAPRQRLFDLIDQTPNLDWLLLTKRPQNIISLAPLLGQPNVWLGVTVEDRKAGLPRMDVLRQLPATVRFLSCEPLLEDLERLDLDGISWVIIGGESGPNRRPMDLAWLESVVRQCLGADIPCFVKQDSDRLPEQQGRIPDELWAIKGFPQPSRTS
jgi:protein gp37